MALELPSGNDNSLQMAALGLNQQMLPVFLALLFAAAVAWLFLSYRLYAELRQGFPGVYEKLGSPRLFMKKSWSTNFKIFKFLVKQQYLAIDDPAVKRICQGLRSLLFIYLVCLGGCLVLLFDRL